jgi:glutamate formiminotransferase/formiminotetrahydrofolate cyclodeaminase
MMRLVESAEELRKKLTEAIRLDSQAFEGVMQAFKLPKDTDEQIKIRQSAIREASLSAAKVPLKTAEMALEVINLAAPLSARGNSNAITDAWSAASLAFAAVSCAGANVRINLASLADTPDAASLEQELAAIERGAAQKIQEIKQNIKNRAAIELL